MTKYDHLQVLRSGVDNWNEWRLKNQSIPVDLSEADLRGASLRGVNLQGVNLSGADLSEADLSQSQLGGANLFLARMTRARLNESNLTTAMMNQANLAEAYLEGANLSQADLIASEMMWAKMRGADLSKANIRWASMVRADARDTNLDGASLEHTILVGTNLKGADLSNCRVYGISAWDLQVDESTVQQSLIITTQGESEVAVDNIELAQFLHLLLTGPKLRNIIDTITTNTVLILGRFTPDRKAVLDALRSDLRGRGYVPILFDFEGPSNRSLTETVSTLAHLSRFVIADITDPKSVPQELAAIVPHLPSVPIQPLLQKDQREYGMFEHFRRYPWVLDPYLYVDTEELLSSLEDKVIAPAIVKSLERAPRG